MTRLRNERHELFAQALAYGRTEEEALQAAGYCHRGATLLARLRALTESGSIRRRIAEIKGEAREPADEQLAEAVLPGKTVTVAMLTAGLLRIAEECEKSDIAAAKNVARSVYMDVAKLNGLIGERNENPHAAHDITAEPLSESEWADRYAGA